MSRKGNAGIMPADEYAAWQETAYLFRSPANARRVLDAHARASAGEVESHELDREEYVRVVWDRAGCEDYVHWQTADRRILKRINALIDACLRDPFEGIGKPEQLKYGAQGSWSRRITEEHRPVDLRPAATAHHR